jgi:hypothetical protein
MKDMEREGEREQENQRKRHHKGEAECAWLRNDVLKSKRILKPEFINWTCVRGRLMFAPRVFCMPHAADLHAKKTRGGKRGRDWEESNAREQRTGREPRAMIATIRLFELT